MKFKVLSGYNKLTIKQVCWQAYFKRIKNKHCAIELNVNKL